MANPGYVRSTDGDNADNGSTVALANATLVGAMTDAAAGDRVWAATNHAESTAGAVSIGMPGTLAAPVQIYCGDFASEPPTAVTTGATVTTTGANSITISGVGVIDGLKFYAATGSSSYTGITIAPSDGNYVHLRNCEMSLVGTNASGSFQLGNTTGGTESRAFWENVSVSFSATGQDVDLRHCRFVWSGGGVLAGSSSPTTLVTLNGDTFDCLLENLNLTELGASLRIFANSGGGVGTGKIRNCRMPATWDTNGLLGQPTAFNTRFEMWNCSSGDSIIRVRIADVMGELWDESTVVRTGGASDGATSYAYKMDTSTNASFPSNRFEGPEHMVFNTAVGSPITLAVEVVHNGVGAGSSGALQNDEFALEVSYPGTSGYPIYTKITSAKANPVGSASDYTSSSETWTTTGLSTPVKQKMSVTFTPQEAGALIWRVVGFKASKGIYYCPKPDLS
jgi:hypothetical protein